MPWKEINPNSFTCVHAHEGPAPLSESLSNPVNRLNPFNHRQSEGKDAFDFVGYEKYKKQSHVFTYVFLWAILLSRSSHALMFPPLSLCSWFYTEYDCNTLLSSHNSSPLEELMKYYSAERLVFFLPWHSPVLLPFTVSTYQLLLPSSW